MPKGEEESIPLLFHFIHVFKGPIMAELTRTPHDQVTGALVL
jgi:hypothetical protein